MKVPCAADMPSSWSRTRPAHIPAVRRVLRALPPPWALLWTDAPPWEEDAQSKAPLGALSLNEGKVIAFEVRLGGLGCAVQDGG